MLFVWIYFHADKNILDILLNFKKKITGRVDEWMGNYNAPVRVDLIIHPHDDVIKWKHFPR